MYQFPDANEVMGNPEPKPLDNRSRYRIIIIGNLLLALFIAIIAIVWFLFFFDSGSSDNSEVGSPLATENRDKQQLTGDFTPIIIDDNSTDSVTTNQAKIDSISTITETSSSPLSAEIKKISSRENDNETTSQPSVISKVKTQGKGSSQSLSAIDAITNELMKNKHTKVDSEQDAEKILERLIKKSKQNISPADQRLVKRLNDVDNPKKIVVSNETAFFYNSIPLEKTSEIDKIMAAMGNSKKPEKIKTIEKIEKQVKKLLKNKENKQQEIEVYIQRLLPETEENKKEIRIITVKENEKLWDIAVRAYGDGNHYKKILEANPILKENPKLLKSGITLRVPL
jgi:nucleoid-associated protein YgaU